MAHTWGGRQPADPKRAEDNRQAVRDLARKHMSAAERASVHWEASQIAALQEEIEEWQRESGSSS